MKHLGIFFLLCCTLSACVTHKPRNKTVTLDYYFNHELRKDAEGNMVRFHYTWEDTTYTGFSKLGTIFRKNGVETKHLEAAPTSNALKKTDIYIIVDPDTKKETAHPHYIDSSDITVITDWVKSGGVLVLFANDSSNSEHEHLNHLAGVLGIHFNDDFRNPVPGDSFNLGCFMIPQNDPIFKTAKKIYIKGLSTLDLTGDAQSELSDDGDIIIATSKYGKGTVYAVGDPWLYNEYVNGRIPSSYHIDNDKAADDLVKWLIRQVPAKE